MGLHTPHGFNANIKVKRVKQEIKYLLFKLTTFSFNFLVKVFPTEEYKIYFKNGAQEDQENELL